MFKVLWISTVLSCALAQADCTICERSNELVIKWREADSKTKRGEAMRDSYKLLESMVPKFESQGKDPNAEDVRAVTRLIGAIYARDYDPRKDVLRLYRKLIQSPPFARDFEDQLAQMPASEREKIQQGVRDLPNFD